jgi:hypothetical protein
MGFGAFKRPESKEKLTLCPLKLRIKLVSN